MNRSTPVVFTTIFTTTSLLAALLFAGDGVPRPPLHVFVGSTEAGRFGTALACAGDIDGDGAPELLVGAPMEEVAGERRGVVRVFSGRDGDELFRFEGEHPFDRFGHAVAGGGDLDGDGTTDLVIGAPTGTPPEGSVQARSGRSGALLWTRVGTEAGGRFGHSVDLLGDLDGDGYAEVVVGAPYADPNGPNSGRVVILSGADGTPRHELTGEAWDHFGKSVCAIGDVDGDGLEEIACGAPFADVGAFNTGSALVFSAASGERLFAVHGGTTGDQLGSRVAAAGDVDGDGIPDLVVGIPGADLAGIDSGGARAYSGADGRPLLTIPGWAEGQYLESVAGVGDLDGDGRGDLLVGAAGVDGVHAQGGRIRAISGASGRELLVLEGRGPDDWFGAALCGLDDVDGDSRPDFAIGAPGHDDVPSERGYAVIQSGRVGR